MEKPFGLEGLEKPQAMRWEPPHQNKRGYYGYNCKMRAQGTGTTHATRKARRAHKQWDYLEEVDPREEELESHLEALEKAKKRVEERMEELRQKKEEEETTSHSYSSSSSASSSRARSKSSKKKSKNATLEKVAEEAPLEKGAEEAPLEKGAKEATLENVAKEEATLEKVVVRRTRRAKNGIAEQLTEADASQSQPSEPTKPEAVLGFTPPLEKGEAAGPKDVPLEKGKELLEKSSADEPKKVVLKARRHRPTVVVDWHNTLEKANTVPPNHIRALERLLAVANVWILSFVNSRSRQQAVQLDAQSLLPGRTYSKLEGVRTCWGRSGPNGKAEWRKGFQAVAIIDDSAEVIQECRFAGIKCYAISAKHCQHHTLPSSMVWKSFDEAVEAVLEDMDY